MDINNQELETTSIYEKCKDHHVIKVGISKGHKFVYCPICLERLFNEKRCLGAKVDDNEGLLPCDNGFDCNLIKECIKQTSKNIMRDM